MCVVGAGAAGVGVADALRDTGIGVTILEKSRGVCGRAATRRRNGCRYDHGANYVKDDGGRTTELLRNLGTEGLVDIEEPVWTFDASGEIRPGDPERREAHKWTWERGITQFAKRVLDRTDATVRRETRVEGLDRADGAWHATDADGDDHGPFDAVVLTPPAPQTATLLGATTGAPTDDLRSAVDDVPFRTIRTLVLNYDFRLDRPWYALVDREKAHPVGWVSREECKPGHVPDGESLLVVQMSPEWSMARYDDPVDDAAADAADRVADLVGDDRLRDPAWVDDQGWRYALPDEGADRERLRAGQDHGLLFAGDWVVGDGRVHAAFRSGVETGETVPDVV